MSIMMKELRELAPAGAVGLIVVALLLALSAHYSVSTGIDSREKPDERVVIWANLAFFAAGLLCLGIGTASTAYDREFGVWQFVAALPMSHRRIWLEKTLTSAAVCGLLIPIVWWFWPDHNVSTLWSHYGLLVVAFAAGNLMGLAMPGFINAAASGATFAFSAAAIGIIFFENRWAGPGAIHAGILAAAALLLILAAGKSGRQT